MSGVILDLDGVLVNSEPCWRRVFAEVANEFCLERGLPDPVSKQFAESSNAIESDAITIRQSALEFEHVMASL